MKVLILIAVVIIGAISYMWLSKENWRLIYVDDRGVLVSQETPSFDDCAIRAGALMRSGLQKVECGKNCSAPTTLSGPWKCQATQDF